MPFRQEDLSVAEQIRIEVVVVALELFVFLAVNHQVNYEIFARPCDADVVFNFDVLVHL